MRGREVDGAPFGRYRLIEVIGQGSVGEVYRAFDTDTRRDVALKLLSPHVAADETFRQRFRREALVTAQLQDPHVIPIHAFGEVDGRLYLDMRLIDGEDLRTVIRTHGEHLPPGEAVAYIEQVAGALDAAHAHGLLHRDVKPSNMLVSVRGFVYLIDFGIARGVADSSLTNVGTTVGTMAYMAPERFGREGAGPSSDIYSLACVLHECLTGHPPFPGDTLEQQVAAHLTADPPRPTESRPDLPAGFDDVIARGMAKDPADRFGTAAALAAAAREALATETDAAGAGTAFTTIASADAPTAADAPTTTVPTATETVTLAGLAAPVTRPEPDPGTTRRRRALVLVGAAAVVVATLGATGAAIVQNNRQSTPTQAVASSDTIDSTSTAAPAPTTTAAPTTTSPPTPTSSATTTTTANGAPSFDQMAAFVRGYYGQLPTQRDAAWNNLAAGYASATGRGSFDSFWGSIRSVTINSISPRNANSVVVGLTYRTASGAVDSESRWVSVDVDGDGQLRIADSSRL